MPYSYQVLAPVVRVHYAAASTSGSPQSVYSLPDQTSSNCKTSIQAADRSLIISSIFHYCILSVQIVIYKRPIDTFLCRYINIYDENNKFDTTCTYSHYIAFFEQE